MLKNILLMELENEHKVPSSSEALYLNGYSSILDSSSMQKIGISEENPSHFENSDLGRQYEMLSLLQLSKDVYKQRLADIDNARDLDLNSKNEEKLCIVQSYLQQVEEQNYMLASTVIELEEEAQKRVKQMEKRLKSTAKTTMEAVINIHECEKEMRRLVDERLSMESVVNDMQQHLSSLKVENSFLRDQNCNLSHDVQALLHVIHHARSTGHWEMNCVTFCEVAPEQIFGPVQSISQLYSNESPQSDFHSSEREHKELNSDLSSHDVSHSSQLSPNINEPLELSVGDRDSNTQCTSSVCNKNETHVFHNASSSVEASMQKCISLPDIGNIYSYRSIMRRSHSCRTLSYQPSVQAQPSRRKSTYNKKACCISVNEKPEYQLHKYTSTKYDCMFGFHKAQSEPYLFMYGDNIYVYRPCEPIQKASNVAVGNDYHLSLPPCQSIDLKFPVDESNLKICDWDLMHKSIISSVSGSPYHKVDETSTCCSSNESVADENSDSAVCSHCQRMHQNVCTVLPPDYRNCFHRKRICSFGRDANKYRLNNDKIPKVASSGVQTEDKVVFQSVGLQVDICDNGDQDLLYDNLFELDLSQLRRTVQTLKHSVLKAEDRAEAKSILIEQLQGHISSAVKEVEMKDTALSNVEKKLELSRNECSGLKEKISSLNSKIECILKDVENLQMMNENLELKLAGKEEKIFELSEENQMLQNQKRALMTQFDVQGDVYESARKELNILKAKTEEYALQIQLQNQTIRNLQDAVVKSKRTCDATFSSAANINSNLLNQVKYTSRGSIVDI